MKDADGGLVGGAQIGEGGADAGGVIRLLRGGGERVAARLLSGPALLTRVIPTGRQLLAHDCARLLRQRLQESPWPRKALHDGAVISFAFEPHAGAPRPGHGADDKQIQRDRNEQQRAPGETRLAHPSSSNDGASNAIEK